jgi:hypothetical protein
LTSQWSEWSACSATCGQGTQYRTRDVGQSSAANCNGYTCPTNAFQERTCQITPCKIDCKVSEWSSFSTCSLECGGGTQIQTRSILIKAEYGGKACPTDLINVQPCNTDDCPTQCTTGPWGNWSACSKTCNDGTGSGTQYRMRQMGRIATADIFLQSACDTQLVRNAGSVVVGTDKFRLSSDVDMLYVYSYDVHGVLSVTNSSITADNNQLVAIAQTPAEGVHIIAIHYGSEAGMTALSTMNRNNIVKAGGSMMHLPEDQSALADIAAAQKGGWTYLLVLNQGERAVEERYDGCGTQEFGGDLQVQQVDANGNCPQQATQTQPCNQQYCPVPCTLSNWTEWSTCSTTCGKGTQSASRYVVQAAMYGGQPCDITYKWQYCNDVPCPQPCKVGAWSPVSQCSKTCGGGTMKRYRNITIPDNYNGPPCPSLTEEEFECNTQACPTPPPPPPTCYSSPCTPAPPPPPPPCKKHNLEFDQQPSQGYYQRFDSVKVKATEFDVQFEVKGCSGASVGFLTDTIDMAFKNAYEVQIGAVDGTQGGIYWGTQSGTPLVTAQHEYLPQPCDQFQAFWITLRQGVMSVGSGSEFGSNKIMSATVPKIVGDGCDCLFVGFAASTEMLTYRYSPPLKSCLADMCASLSSPSAPGDGDHGDGNHNGDGDHGDGDHGDGNHNGDGDHGDGNHSGDGDHGNHNT